MVAQRVVTSSAQQSRMGVAGKTQRVGHHDVGVAEAIAEPERR